MSIQNGAANIYADDFFMTNIYADDFFQVVGYLLRIARILKRGKLVKFYLYNE